MPRSLEAGLLRVREAQLHARRRGGGAGRCHLRSLRGLARNLRQPSRPQTASQRRLACQQASCRALDARDGHHAARSASPLHHHRERSVASGGTERTRSRLHRDTSQRALGDGHHVRLDRRGLGVPRRHPRPLLTRGRWLGSRRYSFHEPPSPGARRGGAPAPPGEEPPPPPTTPIAAASTPARRTARGSPPWASPSA